MSGRAYAMHLIERFFDGTFARALIERLAGLPA
jgi:hypothetical protein